MSENIASNLDHVSQASRSLELESSVCFEIMIFETERYRVSVVGGEHGKAEIIALRHQVFGAAYSLSAKATAESEDEFDQFASHLIVSDLLRGEAIACYRLIEGQRASDFYSSSEFNLAPVENMEGTKLELSRAAVHPEYRTGAVLGLLWRGLAKYAISRQVDYLIGIPSVKITSFECATAIYQYFLENSRISTELRVDPLLSPVPDANQEGDWSDLELKKMIPPLMRTYFTAGALVCGPAAYDPDFQCMDFFMLLKMSELDPKFKKRYGI